MLTSPSKWAMGKKSCYNWHSLTWKNIKKIVVGRSRLGEWDHEKFIDEYERYVILWSLLSPHF